VRGGVSAVCGGVSQDAADTANITRRRRNACGSRGVSEGGARYLTPGERAPFFAAPP
jgi:hypothetical protein